MTEQVFLHTTTRTVTWFRGAMERRELELAPPFQRNPVWTIAQRSYLIGTILEGYPIPELYMQDLVAEDGLERHIVVDGQQRVRACLAFTEDEFPLTHEEVPAWGDAYFKDLPSELKKKIFAYKFVVRVLPEMPDERLREIFCRLNRNVVALNQQELRHATYWGPFIKMVEKIADDDPYWADCGVFTANDYRRMLDQEFISELVIAHLHGHQNKKEKLGNYYLLYEQEFEERDSIEHLFRKITGELGQTLPHLNSTRWRKKSDFYSFFLVMAECAKCFPLPRDERQRIQKKVDEFGDLVDQLLRLEEKDWVSPDQYAATYARAVSRAASDKANRIKRHHALRGFLFSPTE